MFVRSGFVLVSHPSQVSALGCSPQNQPISLDLVQQLNIHNQHTQTAEIKRAHSTSRFWKTEL